MGNSALISRFGAFRGLTALAIGLMVIMTAGISRAAPPTPTDGIQNAALAALAADVASLKTACGTTTPGPQVPACLTRTGNLTVRLAGGGNNSKALKEIREELQGMRSDLTVAFAAFQESLKRGTSNCAQAAEALKALKAGGVDDTAINAIAAKIGDVCTKETLNADSAVTAVVGAGNYRLITDRMILEPVVGAPFAPQVNADKEVRIKELEFNKELAQLQLQKLEKDEDDNSLGPVLMWATLPATGFIAGWFIAGAQNPQGIDGNGDYNYGSAAKGGGIGLATGLAAAGVGHLIWWAVTKD